MCKMDDGQMVAIQGGVVQASTAHHHLSTLFLSSQKGGLFSSEANLPAGPL